MSTLQVPSGAPSEPLWGAPAENPSATAEEAEDGHSAYLEALKEMGGHPTMKLDLAEIEQVAQALGGPHRKFAAIHVAGTNGKGSVCSKVAACLMAKGLRVGVFSSPHLLSLRERFIVNGDPVSEAQFAESHKRVIEAAKAVGATLTFFECCTLIAFDIFASVGVEWAIVETGLGGRLDATNILRETKCCVITSIGWDHTDVLGNSLEAIAAEKAGIFKPKARVVLVELSSSAVPSLSYRGPWSKALEEERRDDISCRPSFAPSLDLRVWVHGEVVHVASLGGAFCEGPPGAPLLPLARSRGIEPCGIEGGLRTADACLLSLHAGPSAASLGVLWERAAALECDVWEAKAEPRGEDFDQENSRVASSAVSIHCALSPSINRTRQTLARCVTAAAAACAASAADAGAAADAGVRACLGLSACVCPSVCLFPFKHRGSLRLVSCLLRLVATDVLSLDLTPPQLAAALATRPPLRGQALSQQQLSLAANLCSTSSSKGGAAAAGAETAADAKKLPVGVIVDVGHNVTAVNRLLQVSSPNYHYYYCCCCCLAAAAAAALLLLFELLLVRQLLHQHVTLQRSSSVSFSSSRQWAISIMGAPCGPSSVSRTTDPLSSSSPSSPISPFRRTTASK
ncbi:hypothetical protein Esti_000575 [Eimeria stiedai]